MSKVKKFEELSPAEINRNIKKAFDIINKPINPGMRNIGTPGKQVVIEGRSGYINRIKDGYVYVEMLDNPGVIEQFELKKALKGYRPEKQKDIVANTSIIGPANASVGKEPSVNKKVVGLEMESFSMLNERQYEGSIDLDTLEGILRDELISVVSDEVDFENFFDDLMNTIQQKVY